jgi:hypothetical protein
LLSVLTTHLSVPVSGAFGYKQYIAPQDKTKAQQSHFGFAGQFESVFRAH